MLPSMYMENSDYPLPASRPTSTITVDYLYFVW